MANTTKHNSRVDDEQVLVGAYNDVNKSITVDSFLVGKVGHKITQAISTTSVANDTETLTFLDDGVTLYEIKIIYTDGTRDVMLSAERIS